MKLKLISLLLALPIFNLAQKLNLRKVILKSDLIISINDYRVDTILINDFTSKVFINMEKVNNQNSLIYKNNLGSIPQRMSLRKPIDGEDFYSYLITDGNACLLRHLHANKTYNNLFFIKKEKNEFQIVAHYENLEFEQLQRFETQIKSMASVEKVKNTKERYIKTLNWFIENGLMPDDDFTVYYKEKGIISDNIKYSEDQYRKVLQVFESGKEELLPIIRKKYFNEIKVYYLQKMVRVLRMTEREYSEYRDFRESVELITNNFNDDTESVNYILKNSLTNDKFESYEKTDIMNHLIDVVKNWELESK